MTILTNAKSFYKISEELFEQESNDRRRDKTWLVIKQKYLKEVYSVKFSA